MFSFIYLFNISIVSNTKYYKNGFYTIFYRYFFNYIYDTFINTYCSDIQICIYKFVYKLNVYKIFKFKYLKTHL